ncbi:murein hydrolase activator EnvC family protein [Paenibacillus thermoaerophilus]|uniref:Murein hydrolase activator EnvC family protein n=1 Tax=Paenibacillus thermoaerophilus TaxID=1215385 RepID=A0ABW2V9G3_9BACL|nr:M23 family metallopeptidase [Paenibacillus thermoaerophilus]TMV09201.1 hypothetical protein FE781_14800 [Paenibacillus thermoaerophilus]
MKRRMVPLAVAASLAVFVVAPSTFAETVQDIQRQIDALTKQENQGKSALKNYENQEKQLAADKEKTKQEVAQLLAEIEKTGVELNALNAEIEEITEKLEAKQQELTEAEKRVAERDKVLKERVKLTYTTGKMSFLDVLMDADSFSDFLDRFETMTSINMSDKQILEENKRDRNTIQAAKEEIEKQRNELQAKADRVKAIQADLERKEEQKRVKIQSLDKEIQRIGIISEEQEAAMMKIAQRKAELQRKKRELESKETEFYKGGALGWPLPGYTPKNITSTFGTRSDPFTGKPATHKGIDIGAPAGSNIVAAEKGVVIHSGWMNGYGNTVILDHGGGLMTLYGHIRNGGLKVKEGEVVSRGQKIAEVGSTGNSTGNHLHFEVRKNGTAVNPMSYLGS